LYPTAALSALIDACRTSLPVPEHFSNRKAAAPAGRAWTSLYAPPSIEDYADRTRQTVEAWQGMNGKQSGDPAKLAAALVQFAALGHPPARFAAGADAVQLFEIKPAPSWPRPTHTVHCPPASRTTTPEQRSAKPPSRAGNRICRDECLMSQPVPRICARGLPPDAKSTAPR